MGVGKTIQALSIAYIYKSDWPLLIIAPSSLRHTWKDEITKWIPTLDSSKDIQLFRTGKDKWSAEACIFIFSYELAAKRADELAERKFSCSIADEAHYLKSRDAKRSQNLLPILMKSKRTILISGTPILSRPVELYNLMKAVRPDMVTSFKTYAQRYCNPKETPYGMDYNGNSCTKELHFLISQSFMIRRLKKDVLSELPEKRR
jgi:SWI/SNF-related matrix-associated actin-dependent regulator of chromatin subfamily A-like protein 1